MRATRLPRLHVITDTRDPIAKPFGPLHEPLIAVEAALAAGARLVQVRPEDHYTDRAAFDLAAAITALCDQYGAVCLINDRVHIAQAVGAHGVHLGADDLPIDAARRILPAAAIIGGTARDPESARAARRAGATYLGIGPVWGTTTKVGLPQPIGLEGLAAVCEAVDLPVIAIGGITAERAALCREAGAHGVAVVGAIASAEDPGLATAELLEAVGESRTAGRGTPRSGVRGGGGQRGEGFVGVGVGVGVDEASAGDGRGVFGAVGAPAGPAIPEAPQGVTGRARDGFHDGSEESGLARGSGEVPVVGRLRSERTASDTGRLRGVGDA